VQLRPPPTGCRYFHYRRCRESTPTVQLLGKCIGRYCIRPRPVCPYSVWLISSCSSGESRFRRCRRRSFRLKSRSYHSTAREVDPCPSTAAVRIRLPLLRPAEPLLSPPATLLQTTSSLPETPLCLSPILLLQPTVILLPMLTSPPRTRRTSSQASLLLGDTQRQA
jgi:hypothetical protein